MNNGKLVRLINTKSIYKLNLKNKYMTKNVTILLSFVIVNSSKIVFITQRGVVLATLITFTQVGGCLDSINCFNTTSFEACPIPVITAPYVAFCITCYDVR